ncbi:uncharacterized protein LOC128310873 [Anopheles moucheti]|uniref:uncharacterized protein LOC128310873 n=1 Tax=Anopheles moucheti TaxID=186751 RepID=UPI0022F09383|nr:uncharacterized protein LOC128310873 [Anopheles moucheti]XP_052903573.1 uncharacterized protein LOC128310873 [Anopheles moucheti]
MDDGYNKRLRQEVEELILLAIDRLKLIRNAEFRSEHEKILHQINQKINESKRVKTANLTMIKEIMLKSLVKTLNTWVIENNADTSNGNVAETTLQDFMILNSTGFVPSSDYRHTATDKLAMDTEQRLALKYPRKKTVKPGNCSYRNIENHVAGTSEKELFKRRHEVYAPPPPQPATYGEHKKMLLKLIEDGRKQSMQKAATDLRIAETHPISVQSGCLKPTSWNSPPKSCNNNHIIGDNHQRDSRINSSVLSEAVSKTTHQQSVSDCSAKNCETNDIDHRVIEEIAPSIQTAKPSQKNKENHRELHDLISYTNEILPKLGRRKSVSMEENNNVQLCQQFGITKTVQIMLQRTDSRQIAQRTRSKSIDSAHYLENPSTAKQTVVVPNKISQRRESKSMEIKERTKTTSTISKKTKSTARKSTAKPQNSVQSLNTTIPTARKSVSKPQNNVQSLNTIQHRNGIKNVRNNVTTEKEQKEQKVAKPKPASAKRTRRSPSPPLPKKKCNSKINSTDLRALKNDVQMCGTSSVGDVNMIFNKNTPPNNDPKVHCRSDYMENCCLCSYNGEQMVQHYVYNHPKNTVYVSRVEPEQANLIRADPYGISGRKAISRYGDHEIIVFRCHFCDLQLRESQELWLDHISKHTGEYRYKCMLCPTFARIPFDKVTHHSVCTKPSMQLWHTYTFEENHLYAYMCNKCNFVQVLFVNIKRHFKEDHPEASSIEVGYTKFSLVNFNLQDEDTEMPYGIVKLEPVWDDGYVGLKENVKLEVEPTLFDEWQTNIRTPFQAIEQEKRLLQPEVNFIKQEILTDGLDPCETNSLDSIDIKPFEVAALCSASEPEERHTNSYSNGLRVKILPGDILSKTKNNMSDKASGNSHKAFCLGPLNEYKN